MLHNLLPKPDKVWITYDIDFIPATIAGGQHQAGAPVWMDVQNGSVYPVFDVVPGPGTDGQYTYPDDATDPYHGRPRRTSGPSTTTAC